MIVTLTMWFLCRLFYYNYIFLAGDINQVQSKRKPHRPMMLLSHQEVGLISMVISQLQMKLAYNVNPRQNSVLKFGVNGQNQFLTSHAFRFFFLFLVFVFSMAILENVGYWQWSHGYFVAATMLALCLYACLIILDDTHVTWEARR